MCSAYPRVTNVVDDVLQRSLDLSCPEAARIVLLDPNPDAVRWRRRCAARSAPGALVYFSTSERPENPYEHFRELRSFAIWLLQYRAYPVWKRLAILGSVCDELHEMAGEGSHCEGPRSIWKNTAIRSLTIFWTSILHNQPSQAVAQLEMVLELIVGRIGSDFTPPRFRRLLSPIHAGHLMDGKIEHDGYRTAATPRLFPNTSPRSSTSTNTCWSIIW